jgi:SAM-dependent methyltransferase
MASGRSIAARPVGSPPVTDAIEKRLRGLRPQLEAISRGFPDPIERIHRANLERTLFDVGVVASRNGTTGRVIDVGGGISLFTVGCALLGLEAVLIDDFSDPDNLRFGSDLLREHRAAGVEILERDVVAQTIDFAEASIDVAVSFHSMEHWHSSPKRLFADIRRALRPGGLFVLAGPNCVNFRKRITILAGRGKWSAMKDWYETESFRGHVREPDVHDLRYIANDMGLDDVSVVGRNWLGYRSPHSVTRRVTRVADHALRPFPSLCSDIYLIARKPAGRAAL